MMQDVTNLADRVLPGARETAASSAEASQPLKARLAEAWQGKVSSYTSLWEATDCPAADSELQAAQRRCWQNEATCSKLQDCMQDWKLPLLQCKLSKVRSQQVYNFSGCHKPLPALVRQSCADSARLTPLCVLQPVLTGLTVSYYERLHDETAPEQGV